MNKKDTKVRPSVRSLAKTTGFSVATISRVINRSETVAKNTREQVQKAMQEAGYMPHPAARALATKRTKTIGVLVPIVSQSIFARFLDALEVELALHGYSLNIATTNFDNNLESERGKELIKMGAEALIFSGANQNRDLLNLLSDTNTPAVCSSIHYSEYGLPTIGYDNKEIAFSALKYLSSIGHKDVAVIHGPIDNNDRTKLRILGVHNAAETFNLNIDFYPTELEIKGGVKAAKQISKNSKKITAIFCLSDILALGVMFESIRNGLRIPEDFSLMGCDNLDWSSLCYPTLTTIRLPTKRMGQKIAQSLISKLDNDIDIKSTLFKAKLLERESTARL